MGRLKNVQENMELVNVHPHKLFSNVTCTPKLVSTFYFQTHCKNDMMIAMI
uniref:Uncharacterized protein n=1 Tax=Arion vulgaris TaxID=1028688 RepID=A0A0B7BUC9_9EUPU